MGPASAARPEVSGVVVITQSEAAEQELRPMPLVVPFSEGEDGTRLLVAYLDEARRRGASYVSDVAFFLVHDSEGSPIECRTGVYPEEVSVPHAVSGSFRQVPVNEPVRRFVTEYEYRCHMVLKPVARMETTYRTRFDSVSRSMLSVPEVQYVTKHEMQSDCRREPVGRWVTRYEFELESQFAPPHLQYVSTQRLKQSAPTCYSLAGEAAIQHVSRIEGVAYAAK
jgi:hypothetical protein